MGVFLFSMKMLKRNYSKAIVYAFSLMFTIIASYIFFDIMSNDVLVSHEISRGGPAISQVYIPITTLLAFIVIIFCCAMIVFASNFFLENKSQEIAVMSISGLNFIDLTLYLVYQTLAIIVLVLPLGLLIGYIISIFVRAVMYSQLTITSSLLTFSLDAFIDTIATTLTMIFVITLYSSGYVYRHDVQYMLSGNIVNGEEDNRLFKFPKVMYVGLYAFGLVLMVYTDYSIDAFMLPSIIGIVGAVEIIIHVLPDLFSRLKKKVLLNNSKWLIALSNVSYSLKQSITLVALYSLSATLMSILLIGNQDNLRNFVTIILGYIVMIVLTAVGIFYKYASEILERKIFFFNLYKIGYIKKQLKQVILREVIGYYGLVILIPLIFTIMLFSRCYLNHDVTLLFSGILLLIEVLPVIIIAIITYYYYQKTMIQAIEGGVHYE